METIVLEDHGQDFLEWDIKNGEVVGCRPFQADIWNGTKIHNDEIVPGCVLEITPRGMRRTTLNYPVDSILRR